VKHGLQHLFVYARISHDYWATSAGLDLKRKILVKKDHQPCWRTKFEKVKMEGSYYSFFPGNDGLFTTGGASI